MADYTQITDFSAKDALASADPEKIILGADVDAELEAIATAVASKLNTSGLLAGILAVDGAGSGIDADNVDSVGPFAIGTWSPTYATTTNLDDSPTTIGANYIRLGSIVLVFGNIDLDSEGAGTCVLSISLPIASNFAVESDFGGSFMVDGSANHSAGRMQADPSNNRIIVQWTAVGADAARASFIGAYKII